MRKLLILVLALITFGFVGAASRTQAATAVGTPQIRIQIGQRHRRWDDRRWDDRWGYRQNSYTTTRIVRYGWRTYRETYLVRYFPNGESQTFLISRERIG